jgi:hypothetical protein
MSNPVLYRSLGLVPPKLSIKAGAIPTVFENWHKEHIYVLQLLINI